MNRGPGGVIAEVQPGSLAERVGLEPGDQLIAINGKPVRDVVDVQFYGAEEVLQLRVARDDEQRIIEAARGYDEELGLDFANPTFDVDVRRCTNKCDFCFVKQNAPGMRRSLYIKDDDYRYSFLFGNFVTLTNLTEEDWARLEQQRLSPLYVSVHATDLELRRRFLARKTAPDVVEQLQRLAGLGIEVHTQVVLVPGLNDGQHLADTVTALTGLYQRPVNSVSVVPIGLTKYHRGECRTYTADESRIVLDQVEPWRIANRERLGCSLVYPSDEWYLLAGREMPTAQEYDGFPQMENGVGMVRQLLDEWDALREQSPATRRVGATLVCGTLIAPELDRIVNQLNALTGADVRLVPVVNQFFGAVTTVSGLLTGQDVVRSLRGRPLGDLALLPRAMFSGRYAAGSGAQGITLDDMSVDDLSTRLGINVALAGTMMEAVAALE